MIPETIEIGQQLVCDGPAGAQRGVWSVSQVTPKRFRAKSGVRVRTFRRDIGKAIGAVLPTWADFDPKRVANAIRENKLQVKEEADRKAAEQNLRGTSHWKAADAFDTCIGTKTSIYDFMDAFTEDQLTRAVEVLQEQP